MMIEALGGREPSLGRSHRDLRGPSCSDSEPEEEAEELGDTARAEMIGNACGGVAVADELNDSITPAIEEQGRSGIRVSPDDIAGKEGVAFV